MVGHVTFVWGRAFPAICDWQTWHASGAWCSIWSTYMCSSVPCGECGTAHLGCLFSGQPSLKWLLDYLPQTDGVFIVQDTDEQQQFNREEHFLWLLLSKVPQNCWVKMFTVTFIIVAKPKTNCIFQNSKRGFGMFLTQRNDKWGDGHTIYHDSDHYTFYTCIETSHCPP